MQALSQLSYTPLQNRSEILNINFAFVKSVSNLFFIASVFL